MKKLNPVDWIAIILVVIGGVNWGILGALDGVNVVELLFGDMTIAARTVYVVVGVAALYMIYTASKMAAGGSNHDNEPAGGNPMGGKQM